MPHYVIFGTGPLGLAVGRQLMPSGHSIRMVNRSGKAQMPDGVEIVIADATDPAATTKVCKGAATVFHCATAAYGRWAAALPPIMNGIIEGASAAGARLVYGDNLYAYGHVDGPINEDLPYRPVGPNTKARADVATTLMNAHAKRKVRATIGRASDFYGLHARQSKAGDGIFARALAGKPAQVVGDPDAPHTLTFIEDFAAALVTLSQEDKALGEVWHVPNAETVTMRQFVDMVFLQLGRPSRLQGVPTLLISLLALVAPPMAAVKETMYQSERPWVVDHSKYARAFGAQPTAHKTAIAQTIAWFRNA
ncbi:MAG TPA: NAD-dependent epimerase/dehydratase family protein [Candidatus Dormibacteraeota bacterium]